MLDPKPIQRDFLMFGFRGAHDRRHARGPFAFGGDGLAVTATVMAVAGAGRSAVFSIMAICAMSCCS